MKAIGAFLLMVIVPINLFGLNIPPVEKHNINKPNRYDYRNCVLTIKCDQWTKVDDNMELPVTATFFNNSDDTLKYHWEDGYWQHSFVVSNKNLMVKGSDIDGGGNISGTKIILPHQSESISLVLIALNKNNLHNTFKMAFELILTRGDEFFGNLVDIYSGSGKTFKIKKVKEADLRRRTHLIWSNIIEI